MLTSCEPTCVALWLTLAAASPAPTAVAPPGPAPSSGAAASSATPPAPAFKAGAAVSDSAGADLGPIVSVVGTPDGRTAVVVKLEGKLVTIPETELSVASDGRVTSRRTRAELLARAEPSRGPAAAAQ